MANIIETIERCAAHQLNGDVIPQIHIPIWTVPTLSFFECMFLMSIKEENVNGCPR